MIAVCRMTKRTQPLRIINTELSCSVTVIYIWVMRTDLLQGRSIGHDSPLVLKAFSMRLR